MFGRSKNHRKVHNVNFSQALSSHPMLHMEPVLPFALCIRINTMFDPMEKPVQLGGPSSSIRIVEHALEVLKSIFVGFLHCQSFPERIHFVIFIVTVLYLMYPTSLILCSSVMPVGSIIVKRVMSRFAWFLNAMYALPQVSWNFSNWGDFLGLSAPPDIA